MEQYRLAKIADCSESAIRRIERGMLPLSDQLATKISLATFVQKAWLLENDLSAPIIGTGEAPYTRETYEIYRASLTDPDANKHFDARAPARLFGYYEVMRRALAALPRHKRRLAEYRINQFFNEFIEEFSEASRHAAPLYNQNTFRLVEMDLKSTKQLARVEASKTGFTDKYSKIEEIAAAMKKHVKEVPGQPHLPE